jgi:hypothetical protein
MSLGGFRLELWNLFLPVPTDGKHAEIEFHQDLNQRHADEIQPR